MAQDRSINCYVIGNIGTKKVKFDVKVPSNCLKIMFPFPMHCIQVDSLTDAVYSIFCFVTLEKD